MAQTEHYGLPLVAPAEESSTKFQDWRRSINGDDADSALNRIDGALKGKQDALEGLNWTAATMPSSSYWTSVTYGNGKFVAVAGDSDKAAYSTDGINWTAATMPSSANWYSVTYGNGKFVAVAYESSNKAAYSVDGITWAETDMPFYADWTSVTYGNGIFVAVAYDSNIAAYSTDGTTWTTAYMPSGGHWQSVTYGNGKFVAVAIGDDTAAYSTDGITWMEAILPSSPPWRCITYGNGKFMAMAYDSNIAAYSTDGITWTAATMPFLTYWTSVTYGNGKFVTVADYSTKVAYSTDGITWTTTTMPSSASWYSVTYGNGKFVAVAYNSAAAAYSVTVPGNISNYVEEHTGNKSNPHGVTAEQVGAIPTAQKGAKSGVASLDASGKVPAAQLPAMDYDPAGSAAVVDTNLATHKEDKNNPHNVLPTQVGGIPIATTSGNGGAYTVTIPGVTELYAGLTLTLLPHVTNVGTAPTLDVNGLGTHYLCRDYSTSTEGGALLPEGFLTPGKPVAVRFNGTLWVCLVSPEMVGAGDMLASVYDPNGKAKDIFAYTDEELEKRVPTVSRTVYVSNDGNDETGDGTQEHPWATLQKAVDEAPEASGDGRYLIELSPGSYAGFTLKGKRVEVLKNGAGVYEITSQISVQDWAGLYWAVSCVISSTQGAAFVVTRFGSVYTSIALTIQNSPVGIHISTDGHVAFNGTCKFNNCTTGIQVNSSGIAYFGIIQGTGNRKNLHVSGGILTYSSYTASPGTNPDEQTNGGIITNVLLEDVAALKSGKAAMETVTIPAGRMRGDINGDGVVDGADKSIMTGGTGSAGTPYYNQTLSTLFPDGNIPIDYLAANVDGNGSINASDANEISYPFTLKHGATRLSIDLLGNWTQREGLVSSETYDWLYSIDVPVEGVTATSSAVVIVQDGDKAKDCALLPTGVCGDGVITLYAMRPPISELTASVMFKEGDGTANVVAAASAGHTHTPEDVGALPLKGGTLTGALTLPGAPTTNMHAATKGYVDTLKAKSVTVTLTAAGWSGTGPYTQTVSVAGLTASSSGDIGLAQSATAEQRAAARDAMISVTGQASASLTVTADGDKPTIDIPCVVTILG